MLSFVLFWHGQSGVRDLAEVKKCSAEKLVCLVLHSRMYYLVHWTVVGLFIPTLLGHDGPDASASQGQARPCTLLAE